MNKETVNVNVRNASDIDTMATANNGNLLHNEKRFFRQFDIFDMSKYGYENSYRYKMICIPFYAMIMAYVLRRKAVAQGDIIINAVTQSTNLQNAMLYLKALPHQMHGVYVLSALVELPAEVKEHLYGELAAQTVEMYIGKILNATYNDLDAAGVLQCTTVDTSVTYDRSVYAIRIEPIDMYEYMSMLQCAKYNAPVTMFYIAIVLITFLLIFT